MASSCVCDSDDRWRTRQARTKQREGKMVGRETRKEGV